LSCYGQLQFLIVTGKNMSKKQNVHSKHKLEISPQIELIIIFISCLIVYFISLHFDIFERAMIFLQEHENLELDEIIIVLLFLGLAFTIFGLRRWFDYKKLKEKKMLTVLDLAPSGIGMGIDHVFQEVNQRFCDIVGYTEPELLGKNASMLYTSKEEYDRVNREQLKLIAKHGIGNLESCLLHKNGKLIDILLSWSPLYKNDVSKGIVFNVLDITELKDIKNKLHQSENKFRSMMESMIDPVCIYSQDYRIEYMNPAMIERTGQDDTGEFCFQAIHGFTQPCPWCKRKDKSQGKYFETDITSPKDNHSYHVSSSPIKNEDGSVSSMIIFRDTTEMKKLEQQLRQTHKLEAVGTLAGGIAHDFNNILTIILGYAKFAKGNIPSDCNADKDIDKVIKGGQRAADLVKQILAFSHKGPLNLRPLSPQLVIEEALKMIRSSLPTTIMIEEDFDPECGKINADSTQLHQIVVNLCTNAFHAIDNEKGAIEVKLQRREISAAEVVGETEVVPGSFIVLSVSDTGCGMDKATIKHIFEPYFTTKDVGKGSGLGLAVIHGIVGRYHGFIRVESEPGKGSAFHIYIPALEKEAEILEKVVKQATLAGGTERVLVVDDEEAITKVIKTILDRLGYKVIATTDSQKALELVRNDPNQFDLLITDQSMPHLSGVDLARKILKLNPTMPIILCTGYSSAISEKEALAIGIRKYLLKPVARSTLVQIVRQVLDERRS